MSLINFELKEKATVHISIEKKLLKEIDDYCHWEDIKKKAYFFVQAARFILKNDAQWIESHSNKLA